VTALLISIAWVALATMGLLAWDAYRERNEWMRSSNRWSDLWAAETRRSASLQAERNEARCEAQALRRELDLVRRTGNPEVTQPLPAIREASR
jgi:hypothetical protein